MVHRSLAWVMGIAACGAADESLDSNAHQMTASASGSESGTASDAESGVDPSGAPVGCVYETSVLGDVDAVGITGVAASEVLAEAVGMFVGGIAWRSEPPVAYTGSTDPSALTLTVTYDGGEIRSMDGEAQGCGELEGCPCEDRLEIDVTWRLQSADGVLDETWSAPLLHEPQSWFQAKPIGISTAFLPDDAQGSLSSASFSIDGEIDSLRASVTFRNGAADGKIDILVISGIGAYGGAVADFAGLRDGVGDLACNEIDGGAECGFAGCVAVIGHQQILDCQCAPYEDEFCFATAPEPGGAMTWYTRASGDVPSEADQVIALPSFGDAVPAPWTVCSEAPEVAGCACANEAPACG